MNAFTPHWLRNFVKNVLGIQFLLEQNAQLQRRVTLLERQLYGSWEEVENSAKQRWRKSSSGVDLTWNKKLPGNQFIKRAIAVNVFGPGKHILEIGPGYGRLVEAIVLENAEFTSYMGLEISLDQVRHLTEKFADTNKGIEFQPGDVETFTSDRRFDSVISSLTFKHLFPSFEKAMCNITLHMRSGGLAFIDFIEGNSRQFEQDGVTYFRHYSRNEITEIMAVADFEVLEFAEIEHNPEYVRLLVIARKMGGH